jgi:hypothetical protein
MKTKSSVLIYIILIFLFSNKIIIYSQDSKHEKWHYYINSKGEEVIKVSAVRAYNFSEGLAAVEKYYWDGRANAYNNYGYIDTTGKLVIKHDYEKASAFKFGVAAVKKRGENHFNIIDKNGKKIIDYNFPNDPLFTGEMIIWREGKSFGIMDLEGNIVVKVGKYIDFAGFDETGLCCVGKEKDANTWLYGFIDKKGNEVIPCTFIQEGTSRFDDGLARMKLSNGKTGFIDTKGKVAIPGVYSTASHYSEGFYPAAFGKSSSMWGLLDSTNKIIIQGKYDDLRSPYKGTVRVELNGKHGFLKTDGSVLIPIEFDNWSNEFSNDGVAILEKGDTKYIYNLEGKLILKTDKLRFIIPNSDLKIILFNDSTTGKSGIMNFEGEIILQTEYCHIAPFKNNRALVRICN